VVGTNTIMKRYVLGFQFDESQDKVLLIKKLKPKWQKGRFNGIGGKIEFGEEPIQAMIREFYEETGVKTLQESWKFAVYYFKNNEYEFYCYKSIGDIYQARNMEEEEVHIIDIDNLPETIYNLKWLIPIILDPRLKFPITIEER